MAVENRIYTQNPHQEVTSAKLNDIQDNFCFSWELDQSTLAPTVPLVGATLYYGQFSLARGAPGLHVLDNSRDWRNRHLLMHVVHHVITADLPKGATYDPQASLADEWNLWYTQTGATSADPPVGFYWVVNNATDNRRIFAASTTAAGLTAGDLAIWVLPGGTTDAYIMVHVIQLPDAS